MVEIGARIRYELIYYTGYMGTRTDMIYDMDGFRDRIDTGVRFLIQIYLIASYDRFE